MGGQPNTFQKVLLILINIIIIIGPLGPMAVSVVQTILAARLS